MIKKKKNMAGVDDGGRCLMDEINALFAPPGRGDAKKRAETASKTELHPYYKRPGLWITSILFLLFTGLVLCTKV